MSFIRRSNVAHVLKHKPKKVTQPELQEVFLALCEIIRPYQKNLVVKSNTPVHYELWTNHPYRVSNLQNRGKVLGRQTKSRTGIQFAAAVLFKEWVSFYLYPLHLNPELGRDLSNQLRALFYRNSKSCMHFTTLTDELKTELRQLVEKCWNFCVEQYWVKPLE
jgi:hypothetical protein